MKETNISQLVRLECSKLGAVMFRNNTGAMQTVDGRWVSFGLCKGSSDLIGIYKGKFVAFEIKQVGKKPTQDQVSFIDIILKNGGIAGVLTSPDDVKLFLK